MTAPIAFAAFRRGLVLRVWRYGALLVQVKMIENLGYAVLVETLLRASLVTIANRLLGI